MNVRILIPSRRDLPIRGDDRLDSTARWYGLLVVLVFVVGFVVGDARDDLGPERINQVRPQLR